MTDRETKGLSVSRRGSAFREFSRWLCVGLALLTFETNAVEAKRQSYHVSLAPSEVRHFVFRADPKMLVSFMHRGDPETAKSCHGRPTPRARFPMKPCAGIYESDGKKINKAGNYAEGVHGGAVSFEPLDGEITVALKTYR